MPLCKTQEDKKQSTIDGQPQKMSSRIQVIIAMDIAGATGNEIAEGIGMTPVRVSVIRNSPLFIEQRARKWQELQAMVMDKKTDAIVAGDPVEIRIKDLAITAINQQSDLLTGAGSEFVRNAVANSILDRAGYKPHTDRTITTIEVTERMADRFEKVLSYGRDGVNGLSSDARKTTVRIKEEMSS